MNLLKVTQQFASEDAALDYLISQRWPNGVRCLACDHDKVYRIATRGKTGKPCRLFECADCGLHFSATTGTLFHDSHLPLQKWFMAMALMCEAKKGVSANQVARHLGCQYKSAWHLCHRIRRAMQEADAVPLGSKGEIVEMDEAFIGGKTRNKTSKESKEAKVKILGLVERGGRIHLETVESSKKQELIRVVAKTLSPNVGKVVTDASAVYSHVLPKEKHEETRHEDEFAKFGKLTATQTIEGAFSLFKRGVIGSYHKLSKDHLNSYLQEFCYRYNRRGQQKEMFAGLLQDMTAKPPLKYSVLTKEF